MKSSVYSCLKCDGMLERRFFRDGVVWFCPQCCRGFYEWMLKKEDEGVL